jgi:hypothetical protein
LLYSIVAATGGNIYASVLAGFVSGLYVYLTFVVDALSTFGYYIVSEIDAIAVAGFNSMIGLAALILLPLITPIA